MQYSVLVVNIVYATDSMIRRDGAEHVAQGALVSGDKTTGLQGVFFRDEPHACCVDMLNNLHAAEGWELVTSVIHETSDGPQYLFYLKR